MVMKDMAMKKLARPMLGLAFAAACVLAAQPALAAGMKLESENENVPTGLESKSRAG